MGLDTPSVRPQKYELGCLMVLMMLAAPVAFTERLLLSREFSPVRIQLMLLFCDSESLYSGSSEGKSLKQIGRERREKRAD